MFLQWQAAVDAAVSQSIEKVSQAKLAALQARWIPGVVVEFNDSDGYSRHLVSIRPERGEEIHFARRANRLVWVRGASAKHCMLDWILKNELNDFDNALGLAMWVTAV